MRKYRCSTPLDPHQACVWLGIVFNLLVYFIFLLPILDHQLIISIFLVSLHFVLIILVGHLTLFTPAVIPRIIELGSEQGVLYCQTCEVYVSWGTKHCQTCNRCIENFDHHCRWLNNCIGSRNYKVFILLLVSLNLVTVLALFLAGSTVDAWRFNTQTIHSIVIVGLNVALNLAAFCFGCLLIGFHVWLKVKKMTTYEYAKERYGKVFSSGELANPNSSLDNKDENLEIAEYTHRGRRETVDKRDINLHV